MTLGIERGSRVVITDPVLLGWQKQIHTAAADHRSLVIAGGGSKAFYGRPVDGERLDTTAYRGLVAYEPTELVITARGGTPLAEVEAALAERGQMLAFEPPHFEGAGNASAATIGGAIAAGLSGPRRMAAGAARDFVLGVRLVDGRGELLAFGGQVMKNVAGYDVSRLMAGSLGCLGVLAEVSLKVVPRPRCELSLVFELPQGQALDRLHAWAGQPLPISASAWHDGRLTLRLSGAEPAVQAARHKLGGETLDLAAAASFWDGLRNQKHPFFGPATGTNASTASPATASRATEADDAPRERALFRLALPDTSPAIALPGEQLIEWGGALRWCRADLAELPRLRALSNAHGGHATVFRGPNGGNPGDAFAPLPAPLLRIHRELKRVFDPAGVFNRGRLYPEF